GLRQGWIASRDPAFIESCLSHRDYNHISCSMFDEAVAAIALQGKEKLLARNVGIVTENLEILAQWVESQPHISWVRPQAGTTALLYYDFDIDSYTFCKRMYDETGAFVTPGDCFEEPHCMRIGYACDKQELIDGLAAMGDFIRSLEA
ncbi:MAG: aminotransferase class I/II-fold pyridoxal phosphate-dependent enzyme, partial [Clostridia bacterium]|nr:aminotransferase class I/II-fold pyridoxal phosphate-dependent enzyme [Clostridia bacterium]